MLDYFWMWQIMAAFGWDLPFEAGLTVGVFLLLSISLPSAPGGYAVDGFSTSIPDAHFCFYPFSTASISPASPLPMLGMASSPSIP